MRTLIAGLVGGTIAYILTSHAQKPADRLERLAVHAWETSVEHRLPSTTLRAIAARAHRQ